MTFEICYSDVSSLEDIDAFESVDIPQDDVVLGVHTLAGDLLTGNLRTVLGYSRMFQDISAISSGDVGNLVTIQNIFGFLGFLGIPGCNVMEYIRKIQRRRLKTEVKPIDSVTLQINEDVDHGSIGLLLVDRSIQNTRIRLASVYEDLIKLFVKTAASSRPNVTIQQIVTRRRLAEILKGDVFLRGVTEVSSPAPKSDDELLELADRLEEFDLKYLPIVKTLEEALRIFNLKNSNVSGARIK